MVGVALHHAHAVRPSLRRHLAVSGAERFHEEDPFTARWLGLAQVRVTALRSRFEVDLNRPRELSVYRSPDEAWGLKVWRSAPDPSELEKSYQLHREFYDALGAVLDTLVSRVGKFVVYDLHSYNDRSPDQPSRAPDVNLGTASMDRAFWSPVVEGFLAALRSFDFAGRRLELGENVNFLGGYLPSWVHQRYPGKGCCLAVEVRKFFMDEETGRPDPLAIGLVGQALRCTASEVLNGLGRV